MVSAEHPILVVDDNEDTRFVVSQVLAFRGYVTAEASTGADALAYLRSGKPACLIILDQNLPDMTGRQVREELKRDPKLARIPVIVFSGLEPDGHMDDVVAYVRKGLDPEQLLTFVDQACGKAAPRK
jgi:CheY-like chemotaxis protein